jgi:tripeptide aminopeptidase
MRPHQDEQPARIQARAPSPVCGKRCSGVTTGLLLSFRSETVHEIGSVRHRTPVFTSLLKVTGRTVTTLLLAATQAFTQSPTASADAEVQRIQADPRYQRALEFIDEDYLRFVDELIELTEIPAPPFGETERGTLYMAKLRELGLSDLIRDAEGNIIGRRRGASSAPLLAVAAHLDTVFPEGTDVTVRRAGTRLFAPGIGDDTAGLVTLLAVIRALDAAGIQTSSDILFIGDVGEEGPGDLRGMKHLFGRGRYRDEIGTFISIEGGRQADITNAALGSRRYRATFSGPGGHSYSAFGIVNPAFAMGNAIQKLSAVEVPEFPRTTFNVGVIGGGTSVNSIPFESWMEVDLRSEDSAVLDELSEEFIRLMEEAVADENAARRTGQGEVELELEVIGERPSGETPIDSPIVQRTAAVFRAFGIDPTYSRSSTDANIPISLGIPAVTIDRGGLGGRSHSLDEWVDVTQEETVQGIQVVLTTILAIAGLEELQEPEETEEPQTP